MCCNFFSSFIHLLFYSPALRLAWVCWSQILGLHFGLSRVGLCWTVVGIQRPWREPSQTWIGIKPPTFLLRRNRSDHCTKFYATFLLVHRAPMLIVCHISQRLILLALLSFAAAPQHLCYQLVVYSWRRS